MNENVKQQANEKKIQKNKNCLVYFFFKIFSVVVISFRI